ncbi:MAG: hypothetical protein IJ228_12230 [Succinivibrio sp.]|nr:hypothetical protein [Succinivibrio sp.]
MATLDRLLKIDTGFNSSVNLKYDLDRPEKLRGYIPTRSAMMLLHDILESCGTTESGAAAGRRARVMIGPYGKGKSQIMLMILSILSGCELGELSKMMPVVEESYPKLHEELQQFRCKGSKLLPVVVDGAHRSVEQALIEALQRTLSSNSKFETILNKTGFGAAIGVVERWRSGFGEVYKDFEQRIGCKGEEFARRMKSGDSELLEQFKALYTTLSAGSEFNPFLGSDVNSVYQIAAAGVRELEYDGLYIVYDEFGKYLEGHITQRGDNDTKVLQDLAELCDRSGETQLHLMLITHRELTSYLGRVDRAAVDGWRGVSERFKSVFINNNFAQTYEIMAAAISKNDKEWQNYQSAHAAELKDVWQRYADHAIFKDLKEIKRRSQEVMEQCFPLHPVTTFMLPRLSEKAAQNERTMFTFLSDKGAGSLLNLLGAYQEDKFCLLTPDVLFDYFAELLRQEIYAGKLHHQYMLAENVLRQLEQDQDENAEGGSKKGEGEESNCDRELLGKIVKCLALIYMLQYFEVLPPNKKELTELLRHQYSAEEIEAAINFLIEQKFVLYLRLSNGYLQLKESSGQDVEQLLSDEIGRSEGAFDLGAALAESAYEQYLYPVGYNDERQLVRFFKLLFIESEKLSEATDYDALAQEEGADGLLIAVATENEAESEEVGKRLKAISKASKRCLFAVHRGLPGIKEAALRFSAARQLAAEAGEDKVLRGEFEIISEDCLRMLQGYTHGFTHPETGFCRYFSGGQELKLGRRSKLTQQLSEICHTLFPNTPLLKNETLNKEHPTAVAVRSRNRVVAGLLRAELEPKLGLTGTGQDVSIMSSMLYYTGVLSEKDGLVTLDYAPVQDEKGRLARVFTIIDAFIHQGEQEKVACSKLYESLQGSKEGIGLRRGVIPLLLAAALRKYRRRVVIWDREEQLPLNAETLQIVNEHPERCSLALMAWSSNTESYLTQVNLLFSKGEGGDVLSYERAAAGLKRFVVGLPNYSRTVAPKNENENKYAQALRAILQENSSYDLLMRRLPEIFNCQTGEFPQPHLSKFRDHYSGQYPKLLDDLKRELIRVLCKDSTMVPDKCSLKSAIEDFLDKSKAVSRGGELYPDGFSNAALEALKSYDGNDNLLVQKMAKALTGMYTGDFDHDLFTQFVNRAAEFREMVLNYKASEQGREHGSYKLLFNSSDGKSEELNFENVDLSSYASVLHNKLAADLDAMGQSMSMQQKAVVMLQLLSEMFKK